MEEILSKIDDIIERYESGEFISKDLLIKMQRELSSNIYFLTKHNIDAFTEWNSLVYNFKGSNAKGVVEADNKVPELRMTRKIIEASRGVSISINNELNIMKRD